MEYQTYRNDVFSFSFQLAKARLERGWTQRELVEKCNAANGRGWSLTKVSSLEHEKISPSMEDLKTLMRVFHVQILMGKEGCIFRESSKYHTFTKPNKAPKQKQN